MPWSRRLACSGHCMHAPSGVGVQVALVLIAKLTTGATASAASLQLLPTCCSFADPSLKAPSLTIRDILMEKRESWREGRKAHTVCVQVLFEYL